ncbi:LuxR family transcriptional regulator [Streptomyces longispororuber]|uniref:LuxR C-terminal-related transcriptional regulator n=1 Tax=Streptomyces longispororuber TaxID=68230 RepID=UPI00210C59B1|nr:LuxR family transcriptional regulator [Streptomyces longispororuber]MCQ4212943.1 LuxR C-terminal-related transcriptional regulator [Streptomyces longispororuber]
MSTRTDHPNDGASQLSEERPLFDREDAAHRVRKLLDDLPVHGGLLRVTGAAGTGRTAVLRHAAAAAAHRGIRVLTTGKNPAERTLSYAALHTLLRPELGRAASLPMPERALLDAAFSAGPLTPAPSDLAGAITKLLALVPGPVLVCVDDLAQLDPASTDTLNALATIRSPRLGMILTDRTACGARAHAPGDSHTVALGRLPDPQEQALLSRTGRTSGYAEDRLVLAQARGNPLALTELALGSGPFGDEAGFGMLPATGRLAAAHEEDLRGLSDPARTVLLVAALSVSPLTHDVLRAATALLGGSGHAARSGLAEAGDRRLIAHVNTEGDGDGNRHPARLNFPEPLLRPALLYQATAARRMDTHAALAQCLTDPAHAAWHTARCTAKPDEEVARRLAERADGPRAGTGVLVVLSALENAARISPDPEHRAARLLRAAEIAYDHGLMDQALRHARQIDPSELGPYGRALLLSVHDLLPASRAVGRERIAELCGEARAVAPQDPALALKLLHAAARRCWWHQAGPAERGIVRQTLTDLRPGTTEASDLAVMALTDPLSVLPSTAPHPTPGLGAGDEAVLLGQIAHLATDLDRASSFYETAEALARADGRYGRLPQILVPRAMGQIWLSERWDTARGWAEEARTIAERTGQPDWAARATATLGAFHALQGRSEEALRCATRVEEASGQLGQNRQLQLASLVRALVSSGTGRYAEAYGRLRSLLAAPATPYAYEEFWGLAFLAEAAPPAGEIADARTIVDQARSLTEAGRAPLLQAILTYADAVLTPDREAGAGYRRVLGPGVERWPLLHAMALFAHGAWLRRHRQVTASRAPLEAAESLFRALGAGSRADQAAAELRATGRAAGTQPDEGSAVPSGTDFAELLSPQQLTIARLAARGLTNRDIGEQLRLSPRTVASHLYQIFPKLAVTSRAELAAKFGAG